VSLLKASTMFCLSITWVLSMDGTD
jgi:hypothetical protein